MRFVVTLSWVLTFFALEALPISLVAPIRASAPLFTLFGVVAFFGERPSTHQWFGIAVTLAAYWAFSVIGRAEGIHFGRNRWVWMLAIGTLVGTVGGLAFHEHHRRKKALALVGVLAGLFLILK